MFVLEEPYVSDLLRRSVQDSGVPVLDNATARAALGGPDGLTASGEFARLASRPGARLYSNSENAIQWFEDNLAGSGLPDTIALFKDKYRFRELIRDMYPDFAFQGVTLDGPQDGLDSVDPASLPKPFIIKPAVGFFSLGVRKVLDDAQWPAIKDDIRAQVRSVQGMYPSQVLGLERFVIEQSVEGEEFAVDLYFDERGEPVIVNILGHLFASESDVSDRVYITSGTIIRRWERPFAEVLGQVGRRAGLKGGFPMHAELRVDANGNIGFIEINPMRFAGWCCTDLAWFAYGVNPYRCYLDGCRPDWDAILAERQGKAYAIVVADIAPDVDRHAIASVDYEAFKARFSKPLELRPVDWARYGVFAFLFAEAPEHDLSELHAILGNDLKEFCTMR